jgi:hypothetical protein
MGKRHYNCGNIFEGTKDNCDVILVSIVSGQRQFMKSDASRILKGN